MPGGTDGNLTPGIIQQEVPALRAALTGRQGRISVSDGAESRAGLGSCVCRVPPGAPELLDSVHPEPGLVLCCV